VALRPPVRQRDLLHKALRILEAFLQDLDTLVLLVRGASEEEVGEDVKDALPREVRVEAGSSSLATDTLSVLAQVESARGQWERAARLFGAVEAHLRSVGSNVPPEAREAYERDLSATRAELGESAWERLSRGGAAMSLEEVINYALEEQG
jgi:hypothetical protein